MVDQVTVTAPEYRSSQTFSARPAGRDHPLPLYGGHGFNGTADGLTVFEAGTYTMSMSASAPAGRNSIGAYVQLAYEQPGGQQAVCRTDLRASGGFTSLAGIQLPAGGALHLTFAHRSAEPMGVQMLLTVTRTGE